MQLPPQFAVLAAMLCGIPATVAALVLLWWPALFGLYGFKDYPLESLKMLGLVLAALYALANYWILAARTIKGRPFGLRLNLIVAAACALVAAALTIDALPPLAAGVVLLPITVATLYFLARQRALQSGTSIEGPSFRRGRTDA